MIKQMIKNFKEKRQFSKSKNAYLNILRKCKCKKFIKPFGVIKIGYITQNLEINDMKIESKDPLFIKENDIPLVIPKKERNKGWKHHLG